MGEGSIDSDLEALVRYMLFTDEAPLREPIRRRFEFHENFSQSAGRAIRRAVPCGISICRPACSAIRSVI